MLVTLDCREHELISLCEHYKKISPIYKDINFIIDVLPIGDIIISSSSFRKEGEGEGEGERKKEDMIIIERKSVSDLAASIKDGRYKEQSYRLNGSTVHNHNIIYLIEGDIFNSNTFKDRIDKTVIYSSMFSLQYYKGFSVLRSLNIKETALMICNMAYKLNKSTDKMPFYSTKISTLQCVGQEQGLVEQEQGLVEQGQEQVQEQCIVDPINYCEVIKKVKKENITKENIGEIMLCQIPGISSVSAIAIMKEFKTFQNLILNVVKNVDCLKNISYINSKGLTRKINKTVITNIIKFLKD
jgi:ERCC4-type nuclease